MTRPTHDSSPPSTLGLASLALAAVLALVLTSCGGRGGKKALAPATAEGLVEMVLTEDAAVMSTCNALQLDPQAIAEAPLTEAAVKELGLEVQANLSVILRTIAAAKPMQHESLLSCEPASVARHYLEEAGVAGAGASAEDGAKTQACLEGLSSAAKLTVELDQALAAAAELGAEAAAIEPRAVVAALEERGSAAVAAWAEQCGRDGECVSQKVLGYVGAAGGSIGPEHQRRLRASARFVQGLRLDALDVQALREDPRYLLRHVDFSFVVLVKMIELGELTERTIDDVTSSLGWVGGPVRTLLKVLAAEIVAAVNEQVFGLLEKRRLVNRAAVARRACGLWQDGGSRPIVATRMLKRTILRLSSAPREDTAADVCRASASDARMCKKVARRLRGSLAQVDEAPTLLPLEPEQVAAVEQQAAAGALAAPGEQEQPGPSLHDKSELLLAAADACHRNDRTDPDCIGDLGSVGLFFLYEDEGEGGSGPGPGPGGPQPMDLDALAGPLAAMHGSLVDLERKLGDMDHKLDLLDEGVARLEQRLAIHEGLQRSTQQELRTLEQGVEVLIRRESTAKCTKEMERVWRSRYLYLRPRVTPESLAALGLGPGTGQGTTKDEEKALVTLCTGARKGKLDGRPGEVVDASVSVDDLCAAGRIFHLGTLRTSEMFASRKAQLNASGQAAVEALRAAIVAADGVANADMKVTVTGHTDQVRLAGKGNQWLSEERAKAFTQALSQGPLPAGVSLEPRGVADEQATDCGPAAARKPDHPCHAQNRRVTVTIDTPAFTMDVPSCW